MTIVIITGLAIVALLILVLVRMDNSDEDLATSLSEVRREEQERDRRLVALTEAYDLAKRELGEEPTIDQIFLTRDSLEVIDGTP